MTVHVILMNAFASFIFLLATVYALRNYMLSETETPFWPAFSIGTGLSVIWTAAVTVEWMGILPATMDLVGAQVQGWAVAAFIVCAFLIIRGEPSPKVR